MHETIVLKPIKEHDGPLTHKIAVERLVDTGKSILRQTRIPNSGFIYNVTSFLRKPHVFITIIFGILLIIDVIYVGRIALIEGCLVILVVIINGGIYVREGILAAIEMKKRLEYVIQSIETNGILEEDIKYTTNVPTIAITQVIRNNKAIVVPNNLLVNGDIVILGYGDRAPAKLCYLYDPNKTLIRDQVLKPEFFGSEDFQEKKILDLYLPGMYHFKVLETPLCLIFNTTLQAKRPVTVVQQHFLMIEELFNRWVIWILFLSSLIVNLVRMFFNGFSNLDSPLLYELLGRRQILVVMPMLPIFIPILLLIANSYGNAFVLTMFDALQQSKTEFEDNEDVDEFDAAPAPTKDFALSWSSILHKFLEQLVKVDGTQVARMRGLIESLAHVTVISSVDREGTIASPIPAIDQILVLGQNNEPIVLDVQYDPESPHGVRFEDKDWNSHLSMLKPFGLSTILMTDCGIMHGRKRTELHFKFERQPTYGAISATRQSNVGLRSLPMSVRQSH
jgi:hypothetical protein